MLKTFTSQLNQVNMWLPGIFREKLLLDNSEYKTSLYTRAHKIKFNKASIKITTSTSDQCHKSWENFQEQDTWVAKNINYSAELIWTEVGIKARKPCALHDRTVNTSKGKSKENCLLSIFLPSFCLFSLSHCIFMPRPLGSDCIEDLKLQAHK